MDSSRPGYRFAKRLLDVTVAALALTALSPILLAETLIVLLAMGRPVMFRQQRPGKDGRLFTMYKFRTMHGSAESGVSAAADDARLARVGRLLRSLSLDELPELLNVLKGEMSLVGPRPLLPEYLPLYTAQQARRHEVLPGMTGWAQVNGRNELSWEEKFALDVWYVDHASFWLDVRILFRTVGTVLRRTGVSRSGYATTMPFDGADGDCVEGRVEA